MNKFSDFVIRFKTGIIITVIILTVVFGYFMKEVQVNSDILSYLPQDDPLVIMFNDVGEKFGGNYLAMIALETDDVFNTATLTRVRDLTEKFEALDGISSVTSVTTILNFKKVEGGIEVDRLVDPAEIPTAVDKLKSLREYALSKDMYRNTLVSEDGRVTLIICQLKEGTDKEGIAHIMKNIVGDSEGDEAVYYAGIPFQNIFVSEIIIKDVKRLVPLVALLVMIILLFSFGSFRGVLLPLSTTLVSLVWVIGLMAMLDRPITLVTGLFPVLLIAVGSAYGIHMLNKYYEDIKDEEGKKAGIRQGIREVGWPIILAGCTTAIGFLSLVTSYISLIQDMGIFCAIGVFFALLISITFIPAMLMMLKVKKRMEWTKVTADKSVTVTMLMDKLGSFIMRRKSVILVVALIVVVLAVSGLPKLKREVNMVEYFKPDSEIRIAEEMMEHEFGGSIPVQIYLEGDMKNPFVLRRMRTMEAYLESLEYVNDPQSVADLVCEVGDAMYDLRSVPETEGKVETLWSFFESEDILDQMLNNQNKEGLVQAKLGTVNTAKLIRIVNDVNQYLSELGDDFFVVDSSAVDPATRKVLLDYRVKSLSQEIMWILDRMNLDSLPERGAVKEIVSAGIFGKKDRLDTKEAKSMALKIAKYLKSEESEMPINKDEVINSLVASFKEKFTQGIPPQGEIEQILRKVAPQELIEADPEGPSFAAESIWYLTQGELSRMRVLGTADRIFALLPQEVVGQGSIRNDIISSFWDLDKKFVIVGAGDYRQLFPQGIEGAEKIHLEAKQSGMAPIFKKFDDLLIKSLLQSFVIAIVMVFILMTIQFRSITGGLISIVPVTMTVLINFGLMGYLGIPIDDATMMIASIAIGIGIDYTLHFITRFKTEFQAGSTELEAIDKTLETTGVAIFINAVAVSMGFLILLLSNIVPAQRFGWLTAVTMLVSSFTAVTVLPALLLITKARFIGSFDKAMANAAGRVAVMKGSVISAIGNNKDTNNSTKEE